MCKKKKRRKRKSNLSLYKSRKSKKRKSGSNVVEGPEADKSDMTNVQLHMQYTGVTVPTATASRKNDSGTESEVDIENLSLSNGGTESDHSDVTEVSDVMYFQQHYKEVDPSDLQSQAPEMELSFRDRCLKELMSRHLMEPLVQKLHENNLLYDFIILMRMLSSGFLDVLVLPFLLLLEVAKWYNCSTTTQMRYYKITMRFWSAFYILCGGTGINFFKGSKNQGQVQTKETTRGQYDPSKSKINFAVPDEKYLRSCDTKVPKECPPGMVEESFRLLANQKDMVLSADGKGVARGLRKDKHLGDINLWGHEQKPTLTEMDNALEQNLQFLEHLKEGDLLPQEKHELLGVLLRTMTFQIKTIREYQLEAKKKLMYMEKGFKSNENYYRYGIGQAKSYLTRTQIWIHKALNLNKEVCHAMSQVLNNAHLFHPESDLVLTQMTNVRRLHETHVMRNHFNLADNTALIKQQSKEWSDVRSSVPITASTAYNALGFR